MRFFYHNKVHLTKATKYEGEAKKKLSSSQIGYKDMTFQELLNFNQH